MSFPAFPKQLVRALANAAIRLTLAATGIAFPVAGFLLNERYHGDAVVLVFFACAVLPMQGLTAWAVFGPVDDLRAWVLGRPLHGAWNVRAATATALRVLLCAAPVAAACTLLVYVWTYQPGEHGEFMHLVYSLCWIMGFIAFVAIAYFVVRYAPIYYQHRDDD